MSAAFREGYGPVGDPARHLPLAVLEAGLAALSPPAGAGRVRLVVRRRPDHVREVLDRARLDPDRGLPGDGWGARRPLRPETQIAVIRHDVAQLIAAGQDLTLFGDNLYVDLDLSEAALPAGTRLRVGEALVEVTPEPHTGCRKFLERFGEGALRLTQRPEHRHLRLRGIYFRVLEAGAVAPGDPIVPATGERAS